jgi:threonine/homoserine/homoserine lactone efflux protein
LLVIDPLLAGYLTFATVLAATPGSTTAVVVRNALGRGRSAGFLTAGGAAFGNTSQATAAGLGLAVIFARWPAAAATLKYAGAAYLAWLGSVSLWRGISGRDARAPGGDADATRSDQRTRGSTSFRQGLTVNLLNPAVSTFYLVVVPSFVPTGAPSWYFAFLATLHIAIAFSFHAIWAVAFDAMRRLFQSTSARRGLEAATGVALLGLALRVVWK